MPWRRVIDFMSENPPYCFPEHTLREVAAIMREFDTSALPVIDNEDERRPVGMVTARDVATRSIGVGRNPYSLRVADVMSSPAVTITEDSTRGELVDAMEQHEVQHVIVVNDRGALCGIVSRLDASDQLVTGFSKRFAAGAHPTH